MAKTTFDNLHGHQKKKIVTELMVLTKLTLVIILQYVHHMKSLCSTP